MLQREGGMRAVAANGVEHGSTVAGRHARIGRYREAFPTRFAITAESSEALTGLATWTW
jgi:hypothetical protein